MRNDFFSGVLGAVTRENLTVPVIQFHICLAAKVNGRRTGRRMAGALQETAHLRLQTLSVDYAGSRSL
jgi:hypothetical protein